MSNESKELTVFEQQQKLIEAGGAKFKKWCGYFLDPQSDTYGNATKSALKAYKTKKYHSAGAIGSENLKKLKNYGIGFLEQEGITVKDWFKVLAKKAMEGSYNETTDFMERFGLVEQKQNVPQNQINQQFNLGNIAQAFSQARKERGLDNQTQTLPGNTPTRDAIATPTGNDNSLPE